MRFIYLFILSIILFSCNNENNKDLVTNYNLESFTKTINLKSKNLVGISQLTPAKFCVFDSILMVSDYMQNPRFHFYNKKTLKKIGEYGVVGEGPEEFKNPECNCQTFKGDNGDTKIMIYEFGYGLIHQVSLSSIINQEDESKLKSFYLNPEVYTADNLFFLNNIVYGEATENKDIKYFKTPIDDTSELTRLGVINRDGILESAKEILDRTNLDRSFLSYSDLNKKFVAAYLRYNKIKFLDQELNEIRTIYFGDYEKGPSTSDVFSKEIVFYFQAPFAADKGVYVPFIGKKNKITRIPQEIHYFNYEGDPIIRYKLDTPIESFTIDEETKKMYVMTGLEEKPFVVYQL